MNMKQPETSWLSSWRKIGLMIVVMLFRWMAEPVTSQSTTRSSSLERYYCGQYQEGMRQTYFLSNLNTTLSSLHQQLTNGTHYALAHTLFNGESIWGGASCGSYVSTASCVSCFNYAVAQLKVCGLSHGAHALYDECDVRYDYYNFSYTDPSSDVSALCDDTTVPLPNEFGKAVEKLLLDLQITAPRAVKYYKESTREVGVRNHTVHAAAYCSLTLNKTDCLECLKLRSSSLYDCLPRISGRAGDTTCFMKYERRPLLGEHETTNITSFLQDGHSINKRTIIWVVVGGVSLLLLVLTFSFWRCGWKKTVVVCYTYGNLKFATIDAGAVYYDYRRLKLATNDFSEENMIGKGGFGEVFKAILDDTKVVAVKKLKVEYARVKVGFENEILLTSQIRHRNLLRLLGWSTEGSDLLLVLEYIPNGSLDKFLWGAKQGNLNWKTRYDIILGIARGLAHLHKEFHVRIVHRDIKSSNILLDDNFQPKIADFGLARFQPEDQSHVTTKFAGTLGYTAPEYVLYGHLSDKVDTYSFGVVILEIVSGQKCTYKNFDASTSCLLEYAWKLYETKNLMKLMDETVDVNQYKEEHVMNIIEIALLCTQSPASKRPTMSEVVLMLPNNSSLKKGQLTRPNFIDHNWKIQIGSS